MFYEILVTKNNRHFFATAERSLTSEAEARDAFHKLRVAFPQDEGFEVTVSHRTNYTKVDDQTAEFSS